MAAKSKEAELDLDFVDMNKKDQQALIASLEAQMKQAAKQLDFEEAATLRDTILELKAQLD